MASKQLPIYLLHIRDCCERLLECAALRAQAANKTDPRFRAAHPEIPWRQMVAARNVLIHARDIPELLAAVRRLIESESR